MNQSASSPGTGDDLSALAWVHDELRRSLETAHKALRRHLEAFPDGQCAGATLRYAVEPEPLDTAGAIRFAAEAADIDDTFVVANGDVLTDLDVASLVAFHRSRQAEATLHLMAVDDPSAFGVVGLDADGRIECFVEKPAPGTEPSNLVNAGTYVLEPSVLDAIPLGQKCSIERVTFPLLVERGAAFGMATDDYWIDTGKPGLYLSANLDLLDGTRPGSHCEGVHHEASVDPAAAVHTSVVGAGAQVAAGAVVERSVVLAGAHVHTGAKVSGSVIMGEVLADAVVIDSVIGADAVVAAGEHVHAERRPDPTAA